MRISRLTLFVPLVVFLSLLVASSAAAQPMDTPADDAVVLPSRVANAITRTTNSLDALTDAVDAGDSAHVATLSRTLRLNLYRADRAARHQMNAVPPADTEGGDATTAGPDSVVAVLTLDQTVITSMAGLFDQKHGLVLSTLSSALFAAMNTRDKLLDAVIALDPEGAGADYSDGMADTVTGYDDEVANITEALSDDALSTGGRSVLAAALARSTSTDAKVNAAFGGGE
jgi:hypothetical protein